MSQTSKAMVFKPSIPNGQNRSAAKSNSLHLSARYPLSSDEQKNRHGIGIDRCDQARHVIGNVMVREMKQDGS
jgi:hypothetical protein